MTRHMPNSAFLRSRRLLWRNWPGVSGGLSRRPSRRTPGHTPKRRRSDVLTWLRRRDTARSRVMSPITRQHTGLRRREGTPATARINLSRSRARPFRKNYASRVARQCAALLQAGSTNTG
jgi:hypothetical protein